MPLGDFEMALASVEAAQVTRTLTGLRFSKQDTSWIAAIIERWNLARPEIEAALAGGAGVDNAAVRGWVARMGRLHVGGVMRQIDEAREEAIRRQRGREEAAANPD